MSHENTDLSTYTFEEIEAEYLQRLAQAGQVEFFYTVHSPYRPTSGPSVYYSGDDCAPLVSLEDARQAVLTSQTGRRGRVDYTEVGYGVQVRVPDRADQSL